MKKCEFEPGVAYRFWHKEEHADVVLCFNCSQWIFRLTTLNEKGEAQGKPEINGAHGQNPLATDFDKARPALVKVAKAAFADDKEIQALKEEK